MSDTTQEINTTRLLSLVDGELDARSMGVLFSTCQQELRNAANHLMGNERENHTLQPTALVNEAYIRLFDIKNLPAIGHAHFVNLAARAMRQILVEHARRKNSAKRGGHWQMVTLAGLSDEKSMHETDLLELNEALEKLSELDERGAKIVELRIFGGMTMDEIAMVQKLSRRTIQKDWRFAAMWLRRELA